MYMGHGIVLYKIFRCKRYACIFTCGLVEVDIDALQLQIGIPVVRAGRVDPMLVRDHLPELKYKHKMHNDQNVEPKTHETMDA